MQELINYLIGAGCTDTVADGVVNMLYNLGYNATVENDGYMLKFWYDQELAYISMVLHTNTIPSPLVNQLILLIVANYLNQLLSMNKLDVLQIEQGITSLSIGDTSFTFDASMSAEQKLKSFIDKYITLSNEVVSCNRKLKW